MVLLVLTLINAFYTSNFFISRLQNFDRESESQSSFIFVLLDSLGICCLGVGTLSASFKFVQYETARRKRRCLVITIVFYHGKNIVMLNKETS